MTHLRLGAAALALALACALLGRAAPPPPPAANFTIDSVHSTALFRVTHLGVSPFWGRFNTVKGDLHWGDDAKSHAISIEIPIKDVDSNNKKRDQHLMGPDFFDAKQFPAMTFKSSEFKSTGKDTFAVKGTLLMRGKSKTVTASVRKIGEGDQGNRFGYRVGFEAEFTIKRSDFGMPYGVEKGILGDEVRVIVAIEAQRQ